MLSGHLLRIGYARTTGTQDCDVPWSEAENIRIMGERRNVLSSMTNV